MSSIFWILITVGTLFIIFYLSKTSRMKEGERRDQDKSQRQAKEKMIRPEKKLHEEEKKRWEDDYWKRQAKGHR